MENKEEFKKPATELKFFISFFFIFISLYFLYGFSLEEVEAMPKGESSYWVYIMNLAWLGCLGFFIHSARIFNNLSQSIIFYNKNNKYILTVLLSLLSIFILSLYWIVDAEFIIGALLFEIVNMFHIGAAIACCIIFYIVLQVYDNDKGINSYIFGLNILVAIMFARGIFIAMGMDDGCRTINADPVFGGGGEVVCDHDYIKQKDTIKLNSAGKKFNSDAVFMAGFIVRSILAHIMFWLAILYLHFKDFRKQKRRVKP